SRDLRIANAPNAATRKKLIEKLAASEDGADRALYQTFQDELRKSDGWSHLLRDSGRYPLTGSGDINTYAAFAETTQTIVRGSGRCGLVLPTGIATDVSTSRFFGQLVKTSTLASLYDFENEEKIFPTVHNQTRFCLFTTTGSQVQTSAINLAF